MIPLVRLARLPERQQLRKAAALLHEAALALRDGRPVDQAYLNALLAHLAGLSTTAGPVAADINARLPLDAATGLRTANTVERNLQQLLGCDPADWDFIEPATGGLDAAARNVFSGMKVYLDDIRSPFNVGSIFRTAEAFGAQELLLSPFTASPDHPRAVRSAMGAIGTLPWRRAGIGELELEENVFVLELGGKAVGDFPFPERGVVVLGSEELGASPEAIRAARYGRVSIPMFGAKGSINVGVAFGILMYAWTSRLTGPAGNA